MNFNNTIFRLLELGALPIINENDTIATDEIKVGDNDTLSALVAVSVKADLLVILSDVDGLYSADPRKDTNAVLLRKITKIDEAIEAKAGDAGSTLGTGGMKTKISAAKLCAQNGCDTVIGSGKAPALLYEIVAGKDGNYTRFFAK